MSDETLFHLALEKHPEERPAFLEQACVGDAELRHRVQALLRSHETPDSFLERQAANQDATADSSLSQIGEEGGPARPDEEARGRDSSAGGPGSRIGPYKLLQPIGEGGMGTVYMAEQTLPVRRTVALKLIKAGMDSRQVLARFGAERQALALMDHPNIAKVFDAGTTEQGLPYFVMELVKGIPITRFCDERRLTLRERLELAIPVCQAVQHAHQKGVIHRDLKPSNVLIALYDGKAVPKVIDFGVAKATGPKLTDQTLYTEFGAVVGTLEYMSPEQAQLNQLDIDTRSDIYSLGVLLYELLTGSTPLDRKRLKQGAILEMLRVIREEESPRPSLRLSTTEELPSIAACRDVEPRKLRGLVRGELDWIVMKALEKDRNRRYETANGLAADLRRYLDDEPVQACSPSAGYRLRKLIKRNKVAISTAILVATVLVVGTVVSTWQAIRAFRAEGLAQARLLAEKRARKEADDNLRKALDAVDRMLTRVADEKLADVPKMEGVRKELLSDAAEFFEGFLQQNKENQALRLETANAYRRLGGIFKWNQLARRSESETAFRQASDLLEELHAEHPTNVEVRAILAEVLRERGELYSLWDESQFGEPAGIATEAEQCLRRAQKLFEGLCVDFPDNPDYPHAEIECMRQLGWCVCVTRSQDESEEILREALRRLKLLVQQYPDRWRYRETLSLVMDRLGSTVDRLNRHQEAVIIFAEALKIRDSLSGETRNSPGQRRERAWIKLHLAPPLILLGRGAEAERHYHDVVDQLAPLVADFPQASGFRMILASASSELGRLLADTGRPDEALRQLREAEGNCERLVSLGDSSNWYWQMLNESIRALADCLQSRGLHAEAQEAYRRAIRHADTFAAKLPDRVYARTLQCETRSKLLDVYRKRGEAAKAEDLYREILALVRQSLSMTKNRAEAGSRVEGLVWSLSDGLGLHAEAETVCLEGLAAVRTAAGGQSFDPQVQRQEANLLFALAWTREHDNRHVGAFDAFRAEERVRQELAAKVPPTRQDRLGLEKCYTCLGIALSRAGRMDESLAAWRQALVIGQQLMADFPAEPAYQRRLALVQNNLAWALATCRDAKLRDPARAIELAKKAVESAPQEGNGWNTLGAARYRAGDCKAAIEALTKSMELRKGGDSTDWFFLAMAHWQLGDKPQARSWYDKAVVWMEKKQPKNEELIRFRAEAAALLGVTETKQ